MAEAGLAGRKGLPAAVEVAVVGGGPAGLAAAIAARQAGFDRVAVFERFHPPIDKACGEGLMPDGVACLRALGLRPESLAGRPFLGIRYLDGELAAEGRFPGEPGLGVRRLALHQALAERAEEIGVELHWGVKVRGYREPKLELEGGEVEARWVVAADGLHSPLRASAGLAGEPTAARNERRFGVRRHFRLAPWSDFVEVYWHDSSEAYVTPVSPDEVGVAILWSGGTARFDSLLERFPALARRLAGAPAASKDRGAGPLLQRVREVTRGRLALLGDAAGYLDAITGEGLSLAFHQALELAECLRQGDLARYRRRHAAIGRLPNAITRLVLALERHPKLRRRAIAALAAEPELFNRLVGIHSRALPLSQLPVPGVLRLAWQLAWG